MIEALCHLKWAPEDKGSSAKALIKVQKKLVPLAKTRRAQRKALRWEKSYNRRHLLAILCLDTWCRDTFAT